jgi:tetratricopeptide (TPR) repeat protein
MADGTPKLLDFGIAKILGERSRELTTRPMMTPAYASPEQLHGGHLTTATDVYSLGVVLYELLSGRRPRATRTIPKGENEQEDSGPPLPPSVALTTVRAAADASGAVSLSAASISQLRGMQPQQLRRHLCGDLDAIVLKALDGDPSRRYTTIEHLTMDVDRYINGLPVHARRGRWRYRAGKFIRRHTISVTCIAVAGIATIASLVNAVQHGRSAAIQRDKAQHVIAFLKDVLAAPDPRHDGREVAVRDVLETAAAQLEDVQDMPLVRASIEAVVGTTFHSLGDLDVAESHLRVALMLRRNHGEELEVAESLDDLGHLLTSRGRYDEAGPLLREALDMRREQLGDEAAATADSLNHLAKLQHLLGDFESAKRMRTEELRIRRALHAQPHVDLASACINMAALLHATEDWAAAEQLYLEALSIYDAVLPLDHPDRSDVLNNLGMLMKAREQLSDAEIMLRQALAIRSATLGDHHPNVARTLSNLGSVLIAAGRTEEAEQALRQALDLRLTVLGEHHPDVAVSQYKLGGVLMLLEKYEDAAPLLASAGETSELVLPAGHRRTLKFLRRRALCAQHLTHYAEAEELLRSCLRQEEASEGPVDSTDTLQALLKLYDEWGRPDAADEIRHKHDM